MDFPTFLLAVLSIIWISTMILTFISRARKSHKLPPGPYRFPIIGNILEIGPKPHKSLTKLAAKYGPVMSLKLGTLTTVIISSPKAAKTVLQTHDLSFSSRTIPGAAESLGHHEFSMVWLPVENQWRKLRKICREHMFSVARLDASQGLRREKLRKLRGYVGACSETGRAVDIGDAAFTTALNLMSATLFSLEFAPEFDSDSSQEMKDVVWGVMKCVGSPNFADYFPILKPVDPQGILKEAKICFQKLFVIFDGIIDDKFKSGGESGKEDLLEALIEINRRDENELTKNDIKHLLLDLFVAGTDTTSGTVEWAMSELLKHPHKMCRVRQEIRDTVGENVEVEESDISRLPYRSPFPGAPQGQRRRRNQWLHRPEKCAGPRECVGEWQRSRHVAGGGIVLAGEIYGWPADRYQGERFRAYSFRIGEEDLPGFAIGLSNGAPHAGEFSRKFRMEVRWRL
ncbi:hypothetical protein ABFS83_03G032700 [Erythranthe nasuta]